MCLSIINYFSVKSSKSYYGAQILGGLQPQSPMGSAAYASEGLLESVYVVLAPNLIN